MELPRTPTRNKNLLFTPLAGRGMYFHENQLYLSEITDLSKENGRLYHNAPTGIFREYPKMN
ncbi:hypothetical protein SAMN05216334_10610 [Nitrosomonas ureae]|uniref:Uncharacterized protein n=1 Tax=Nitrosomonas ureae TaxID=44577 RepID=A0A1H5TZ18_9PROT|nr:hypothetical protein SAMN05216334_10610 [Nitrosomonas ureae]